MKLLLIFGIINIVILSLLGGINAPDFIFFIFGGITGCCYMVAYQLIDAKKKDNHKC